MTTTAWTIRDARPEDGPAIVEFNRRLARESEHKSLDPQLLAAGVQRALADRSLGRYFVAEHDGRVIAQLMITFEWSDWRNGMFWWLQSVFVDERWRSKGVFRSLYGHVEKLARDSDTVCGIRLYADERNTPAHRVYAAVGLRPAGYFVFEKELPRGG